MLGSRQIDWLDVLPVNHPADHFSVEVLRKGLNVRVREERGEDLRAFRAAKWAVFIKARVFRFGPGRSPGRRPGGAVLILDTPKSNKMYANYIDRFVMGTAFDEGVLILDTPKSDKMYANYIDRFLMTAAFDEGVGEAELVQ